MGQRSRLWIVFLVTAAALPTRAGAGAIPVSYQIQPDSSITQCPAGGSLGACVVAPVSGIIVWDAEAGVLDTSGAPLVDPDDGSLDLAIAIWSGLDQLIGFQGSGSSASNPFPGLNIWYFRGTIGDAPINVSLIASGAEISLYGGTDGLYTGPSVIIDDLRASVTPEPTGLLLLVLAGLLLWTFQRPLEPRGQRAPAP